MKRPNTHNKRKRERQEEALARREANVKKYRGMPGGAEREQLLSSAEDDVKALDRKLRGG